MAKYYCKNGNYKTILDAVDMQSAAKKMLYRMVDVEGECAIVSLIGEKGFSMDQSEAISMIPFMKAMDLDLPSDEILISRICEFMGVDPRIISQEAIDWFLHGQEGEDE